MEWAQFAIILITFVGLFIWNRTESRNDIRHMDTKLEANRELVRAIHNESKEIITAIQMDMRDFHYKLLEIEKRKNS